MTIGNSDRTAYTTVGGKSQGKRKLERLRNQQEDFIRMDLKEIDWRCEQDQNG
jgi:hypothetical protein